MQILQILSHIRYLGRWVVVTVPLLLPVVMADTLEDSIAQAMDLTVDPCEDFYQYACGGWIKATGVPTDKRLDMRGFSLAEQDVKQRLGILIQDAAAHYPSGDVDKDRLGALYKACMAAGQPNDLEVLRPYLNKIDAVANTTDFLRVAGELQSIGVSRLFSMKVVAIAVHIDAILPPSPVRDDALYVLAGDPGYPDGDIYWKQDDFSTNLRNAESDYIAYILTKLGESPERASSQSHSILKVEKVLSDYHASYGRVPQKFFRAFNVTLARVNNDLPWQVFFDGLNQTESRSYYISPQYLHALADVLTTLDVDSLRSYLKWSVLSDFRSYLPAEFQRNIADTVFGPLVKAPRQQVCIDHTASLLDGAASKLLVENDTTAENLAIARKIINSIGQQFKRQIAHAPWLDATSRIAAETKLKELGKVIGYQLPWREDIGLDLSPTAFLADVIAINEFTIKAQLAQVGLFVDAANIPLPDLDPAQTVNAYYFFSVNETYLPAGILRSSFLSSSAPVPVNYAGFGFVASHEFMHGFDDRGRHYEGEGVLQDLFTKEVNEAFDKRSSCVKEQYASYQVAPGVHIKGRRTLEENLSDVNGLKLAYQAYRRAARNGPANYVIGTTALTADQLFFVSYAQNFCAVSQPGVEAYRSSRSWWRYASPKYRALGPLVNRPPFANAFACRKGTPMNPLKKCNIW